MLRSIKSLLKSFSYAIFNIMLHLIKNITARHYTTNETIVLSGTSRGGTTLLAEIVSTLPKTQLLWEPLRPSNNRECERYGFGWHHYFEPDKDTHLQKNYIDKLFNGELIHSGTLYREHFSLTRFIKSKRLIVKFVNANRILSWITHNFSNPVVLLLRHPCAVIASQLNHTGFSNIDKRDWLPGWLTAMSPGIEKFYHERIKTDEEILCWDWCIDTVLALEACSNKRIHLLTYESLIINPEKEIQFLFDYLKESVPAEAYTVLRTPSATASKGVEANQSNMQLERWRKRLTEEQIQNIEKIARSFGLGFYFENKVVTSEQVVLDSHREIKLNLK